MDRQGLPGIAELFREQERLAKKLSQEELNALRLYIQKTVHAECEAVAARMRYLQTAHEVNESQYQHALRTLQKDLSLQQTVATEFRREFSSLARVLQAREQRYQDRQETLLRQIVQGREAVREAEKAKEKAEGELQQKEKELNQQKDLVVDLEDQLVNHQDCHKLHQEISQLHKDLLKAKMDTDKLRKELADTTMKVEQGVKQISVARPVDQPKFSNSLADKNHDIFSTRVLPPKNSPVTFIPATPYCTSNTCRARQDLEECRVHFIKKCQEVVYLKTALSEQNAKTSRDRTNAFPMTPQAGKPSAAAQSLKPACQRGKELAGLPSICSKTRVSASVKALKLGPGFHATDKKQL